MLFLTISLGKNYDLHSNLEKLAKNQNVNCNFVKLKILFIIYIDFRNESGNYCHLLELSFFRV